MASLLVCVLAISHCDYYFHISRRCGPRLSAEAASKLRNRYVMMRTGTRQTERDTAKRTNIPVTVRSGLVPMIALVPATDRSGSHDSTGTCHC